MFHIALHEPKIAPNTGNIIRLCANNGCRLHLIEPMGFDLEEKSLRRAGLDYHDRAKISTYPNLSQFLQAMATKRIFAFTTKGHQSYEKADFKAGDVFLFGSETQGLPQTLLDSLASWQKLRIPMLSNNRSMNLSNSVAIASYEAWRQQKFKGA